MIQQEIEIVNKLGLHARASAKFTQLASKFKSGRRVNGKSIMGVMMLAAGKGSKIMLETDGADEQECFDAIVNLVNDKFGEGE